MKTKRWKWDQTLAKLSEKYTSRLLEEEEHGFKREHNSICPLATGSQKSLALFGLSERVFILFERVW